jgi:hypothetical protein
LRGFPTTVNTQQFKADFDALAELVEGNRPPHDLCHHGLVAWPFTGMPERVSFGMANWNEFYFLCGSAAASLTGLMFIAVTFGSHLITHEKLPYVEAFFSPISDHFIQVFVLCAVALVPVAGPKTLGATIVLTTAWRFVQLARTHRMTKAASMESTDIEQSDWVLGLILPAAVYVSLLAAGVCYLFGIAAAPALFAISLLCLLVVALRRAWEMLVWIATKVD